MTHKYRVQVQKGCFSHLWAWFLSCKHLFNECWQVLRRHKTWQWRNWAITLRWGFHSGGWRWKINTEMLSQEEIRDTEKKLWRQRWGQEMEFTAISPDEGTWVYLWRQWRKKAPWNFRGWGSERAGVWSASNTWSSMVVVETVRVRCFQWPNELQAAFVGMREGKEFKWLCDWGLRNWKWGRATSEKRKTMVRGLPLAGSGLIVSSVLGCAKFETPNLNIQVEFL